MRSPVKPAFRSLAAFAALFVVAAQNLGAQTIAITGGKVYPVSGPVIERGTVVITNGRITAVGANVAVPAGARTIDATGRWITPGLVNAQTQLGAAEAVTQDAAARGEKAIAASFRVWEGINPSSTFIAPTRQEGITTVAVHPGRGLISGQAAVIDLLEGSVAQMLLKGPAAMVGQIGDPRGAQTGARGELMEKLREVLRDAKTYQMKKAAYDANQSRALSAPRADLEALLPVVNGTLPLILEADRASDIEAALAFAKEFGIRLVISGGAEAWQVAGKLGAAKVPVMVGAMSNIPTTFNTLGQRQENAGLLRAAGVTVVLISNGAGDPETFNARNLRFEAGNAVAYGMKRDDALRSITLAPAEVLGVADRVGSLQPGREGNVVIWSGDPFEFATRAEHVFVRGAEYTSPTRQDELTERYKKFPPAYRRP